MLTKPRSLIAALSAWDQRLTIGGRLILLTLSVAFPFALYLALSAAVHANEERAQVGQQMLGLSRVSSARLDDYVGDIRQLLIVLAQAVNPADGGARPNNALLRQLRGRLPPEIDDLSVWSASGRNVGVLDERVGNLGETVPDRLFFRRAMASNDLNVEAPVRSASNGEPIAVFSLAIQREGRVVGVVAASARLKTLQSLLAPEGTLPSDAVVTVFDDQGVVVSRSLDPDRWIGRTVPLAGTRDRLRDRVRKGVREGPAADGVDRIAAATPARRIPWVVYVGIPTDTALLPARKRVVEGAGAGLAMLAAGLLGAVRIGRRISGPLVQLGGDAAALEGGDLGHRSSVRQGGEIGSLAHSLNCMADTLQERATSLMASQSQLRAITDNLPVLISYIDRERRFRFANSVYRDWIDLEPDALIGKSLAEVYGAEVYAKFEHHISRGLTGERTVYERILATLAGPRQVEVTLVPHIGQGVEGLFVLIQDVTQNREAVARRLQGEERLTLALEGSGSALFDWDVEADNLYHSPQASALRGEPAREEVGRSDRFLRRVHPDDRERVVAALKATVVGEKAEYDAEFRVGTPTGDWVWLRGRGRVVERGADGRAKRLAGTYSDITQRRLAEERLKQLAQYDSLTGLPNRALFMDRLAQALARQARAGSTTAVLFLDIDHFKAVNDALGHAAGDQLLVDFARSLRGCVRAADTVARLSGDEFTIILEGLQGPSDAELVAAKLVDAGRRSLGPDHIRVSTSIGVALMNRAESDPRAILRRADLALYEAKRAGRDRFALAVDEFLPVSVL